MSDEFFKEDDEKKGKASMESLRKISKVIFDEATGTLTLKIATEEEIAKAEKEKSS